MNKLYEVNWTSPTQGVVRTEVSALNTFAAREQVESMYAHVDGFSVVYVKPVTEEVSYVRENNYTQPDQSSYYEAGSGFDSWGEFVGTCIMLVAMAIILYGLFTLPNGLLFFILGAFLAWVAIKVALKIDGY